MSRVYGRSMDLYQTSRYIVDSNIPKYKKDKRKTSWEDVIVSPEKIDPYLPDNAIKIMEKNPLKILHYPLLIQEATYVPECDGEEPILYFPRFKAIEEYKRNLVYYLGELLVSKSTDNMPDQYNIPCEFNLVLALLMEYLYLKGENKEDIFSIKHLNDLKHNAKQYIKVYETHRDRLMNKSELDLYSFDYKKQEKLEKFYADEEENFLRATLISLVPMSSVDGVLQVIDKIKDKEEIKSLIEKLVSNPNHDRQKILNDYGVESYSFKRLVKEIDRRGNK